MPQPSLPPAPFALAAMTAVADASGRFAAILYFVVLPMLLLIGLGFVVQKRLGLEMTTLTRLNFYVVIPGMVYASVVTTRLDGGEIGRIMLFGVCLVAAVAAVTLALAALFRVPPDRRNALVMTTIFNNSGNYGLPLQDLAFRPVGLGPAAVAIQVFTMIVQNIGNFTVGVWLAATGRGNRSLRDVVGQMARFPPLYALAAAAITIQVRRLLGDHGAAAAVVALRPFWDAIQYLREAFVAVALCTLGAQLATVRPAGESEPVALGVFVRLILSPLIAAGLIRLLGIDGLTASVLLVGSATPSAVNAALLAAQFDNHPGFVARAVFLSTVLSPLTVTLVILLAI